MLPDQEFHRMLDQAGTLRQKVLQATSLAPIPDHRGGLLVVVGAQPGVGASTVAAQLAWQLYRRDCPVGFVQLVNASGRGEGSLGEPRRRSSRQPCWEEVAWGQRTLREAWRHQPAGLPRLVPFAQESEHEGWLDQTHRPQPRNSREAHTASTASDTRSALGPWGIQQLLLAAADRTVVVDAGLGPHLLQLLPVATHFCLVMDVQENRAADQYACLKHLSGHLGGARCWLVMNRVTAATEAASIQQRMVATADRFLNLALGLAGCLPENSGTHGGETAMAEEGTDCLQENWGVPAWREALTRMAGHLEDALVSRAAAPEFTRMAGAA